MIVPDDLISDISALLLRNDQRVAARLPADRVDPRALVDIEACFRQAIGNGRGAIILLPDAIQLEVLRRGPG